MMKFFPTFAAAGSSIDIMEMGITRKMYEKLQKVAEANHCVIMIRKTNIGSVLPFQSRTAVGKKLATKGKSSAAFFTKGNIAFLAELSKKLNPGAWYKEQCTLIGVMGENAVQSSVFVPKYRYIPKLITDDFVKRLPPNRQVNVNGGIEITIDNDIVAGTARPVTYRLMSTTWGQINQDAEFKDILVPPQENIAPETRLYRVYVKVADKKAEFPYVARDFKKAAAYSVSIADLSDQAAVNHIISLVGKGDVIHDKDDFYKVGNDTINSLKLWQIREDYKNPDRIASFLADFQNCAPAIEGGQYREVRVLAIRTKEWQQSDGAYEHSGPHKYFEVVADYDIFLIAPRIGKLRTSGDDLVIDVNVEPISVLPRMGSALFRVKREKLGRTNVPDSNPYGLLSPFELHVRQEINKALGVKVAQHGAEVANLHYTSDIRDPVIAIFPTEHINRVTPAQFHPTDPGSDVVDNGPCLFQTLEMLFELMAGRDVSRPIPQVETNGTYDNTSYSVDGINFSAFYGIIFNLNWGTETYYDFINVAAGDARRSYEASIDDIFTRILQPEAFTSVAAYFGAAIAAGDIPISIKALLIFLYLGWRRHTGDSMSPKVLGLSMAARKLRLAARRNPSPGSEPQPDSHHIVNEDTRPSLSRIEGDEEQDRASIARVEGDTRNELFNMFATEPLWEELGDNKDKYLLFLQRYYGSVLTALRADQAHKNEELEDTYKRAIKAVAIVRAKLVLQRAKVLDKEMRNIRGLPITERNTKKPYFRAITHTSDRVQIENTEFNRIIQPGWCGDKLYEKFEDLVFGANPPMDVLCQGRRLVPIETLEWYCKASESVLSDPPEPIDLRPVENTALEIAPSIPEPLPSGPPPTRAVLGPVVPRRGRSLAEVAGDIQ